ncbi:oxidoreductase [bacterium]|nr:oxidoreductase [bacterium]
MTHLQMPWLGLSVLIPLTGAIVVGLIRDRDSARRRVSVLICLATMVCTLGEWASSSMRLTTETTSHVPVLELMFPHSLFAVDELSAPLLPLAGLLYFIIVLTTMRTKLNRFSFGWTLTSEAILLATLSCRDPWTIVLLLSLATIPPWIELRQRNRSSRVYLLHMLLFVGLLVSGMLLTPANASAENPAILGGGLIALAALLRNGVIPLHCWITDLFEKATFGTAILFLTPMTGAYAVIRLLLPIAPDWGLQSIAILSLMTAVYAAGMALVQHETRRFFCYLFLSHSSLVLVGLEMVNPIGLTGALCVWLSVGISLLGFGLTLRSVEARAGRLSLDSYHGLIEHTPILAALFLLTGLSSIGFPGTVGFVGAELLVEGAVEIYPLVGLAVVVAAMLNGIAIMQAYFRIFTGARHVATVPLGARLEERLAGLILIALIVGGGLYPQPGVSSRYHAAVALMEHRGVAAPASHHASTEIVTGVASEIK